jgi:hypothetical protein
MKVLEFVCGTGGIFPLDTPCGMHPLRYLSRFKIFEKMDSFR